jgi:hypothetical protein
MSLSVLIVTGQSGSGKSTVIRALEDLGYFCVDNIPASLVQDLLSVVQREGGVQRLALVMDIRERGFVKSAPALLEKLRQGQVKVSVIFLEAKDESVIADEKGLRGDESRQQADDGTRRRAGQPNSRFAQRRRHDGDGADHVRPLCHNGPAKAAVARPRTMRRSRISGPGSAPISLL